MTGKNSGIRRIKIRRGLHVVKRADVWYAEECKHGHQTRRSLDTGDATEATRRAAAGGVPPAPEPTPFRKPTAPALTLEVALTNYETWYGKNRRASGAHRALPTVRWFVEAVGEQTDARTVTREHVQRFIDERADGRASITARGDFAVVRAFLRWIAARKDLPALYNVCRGVDVPKDDETTREAPSVEKVRAVFRKVSSHPWLEDFVRVLAETGMRPAELLGARGIDLRKKLLSIVPWAGRQLKSKWSKRTIELNETAAEILKARVDRMFDKALPIFATEEGTVYRVASVYHLFRDQLAGEKRGNVPPDLDMTLYDFRHFFCSEHAAPGPQHMELEALGAYIGHSPKSRETLLRWYTDQNALRRGAPASLFGEAKEGKVVVMQGGER